MAEESEVQGHEQLPSVVRSALFVGDPVSLFKGQRMSSIAWEAVAAL